MYWFEMGWFCPLGSIFHFYYSRSVAIFNFALSMRIMHFNVEIIGTRDRLFTTLKNDFEVLK